MALGALVVITSTRMIRRRFLIRGPSSRRRNGWPSMIVLWQALHWTRISVPARRYGLHLRLAVPRSK